MQLLCFPDLNVAFDMIVQGQHYGILGLVNPLSLD